MRFRRFFRRIRPNVRQVLEVHGGLVVLIASVDLFSDVVGLGELLSDEDVDDRLADHAAENALVDT